MGARGLFFLCGILLLGRSTLAQTTSMKSLNQIGLAAEVNGSYTKNIGLTSESVGSQLLVGVKRDLPRLKIVSVSGGPQAMTEFAAEYRRQNAN